MSKKQTTNTFGKGMMLDLHPLTVPSDVLTDALNATTITMNGNEGILQNDMGNGRVESAFLPPGYVPVGIKEYGGIIYVASYNPVTNKSQIGSFPSPERNIDLTEEGENPLQNPLKLLDLIYKRNYKFSEFNVDKCLVGVGNLTNKIEIFGDYKIIKSGDKFGFYFVGDNDVNKLSNYFKFDNILNKRLSFWYDFGGWDKLNGVYLNNIITLSTQVLDSNSNLRDLTHLLKRFDKDNKLVKFNEPVTEDDKFNCGYFISKSKDENWDSVNQERDKKALNTYNNKLFGKLYLVGRANLVEYIDVLIVTKSYVDDSIKNYIKLNEQENSKILYFHIDYYFNCPEKYLYIPKIFLYYDYENTDIGITKFKELTNVYERSSESEISNIKVTKKIDVTNSNKLVQELLDICHIDLQCHLYEVFGMANNEEEVNDLDEIVTEDLVNKFKFESENINNCIIVSQNSTLVNTNEDVIVDGLVESHEMNTTTVDYQYYSPDEITYDPLTNLYRKRYVAYLKLTDDEYPIYLDAENEILKENTVLNYIIIPQMKNLPGESINNINKQTYKLDENYISKLTHIATEGSIDLSKIGSGECNIVAWRYICTDDMIKLNWGLEDYPLDTDIITDTRMEFYDWNNIQDPIENDTEPNWTIYFNLTNYSSINTSISFGENTLQKRHIYIVKLARQKNDNEEIIGWRILITTSIYNDLFLKHNDYCSESALRDILDKNKVDINFNISLETSTKTPSIKNKNIIYKKNSVIVKNNVTIQLEDPQETLLVSSVTLYYFKETPDSIPEGYTLFSYVEEGTTYYTYYKVIHSESDINGYHLEFYDETHDDLIPDDLYNIVNYTNNLKSEPDDNTYAELLYTSFQTNKKIKLNFDIPDIYPFEICDKSKITYKILPNSNIEKDILYSMVNEELFPVIENLPGHLNEYSYKLFNEDAIYNGESVIRILSLYNFPSIAIYKFSDTKKRILSKNTYVSMYEFMENELPDKILFPYIGALDGLLNKYVFDILYIDEYGDISRVNKKHLYSSKLVSESRIKTPSFNLSSYKELIDEMLTELELKDSVFLIVGSPITFKNDWDSGDIMDLILNEINSNLASKNDELDPDEEEYELYDSGLNANCMLRHYQYTYGRDENHQASFGSLDYADDGIRIPRIRATRGTKWVPDRQGANGIRTDLENQNFPDSNKWGHKDWFMLLWKNKDGEFTVVNRFYAYDNKYIEDNGIDNQLEYTEKNTYYNSEGLNNYTLQAYYKDRSNLKDWIIRQIFGDMSECIFFKTNVPKWIKGYPVDMLSIAYNSDYNVEIVDLVNIHDIKFKDNLLRYYDTTSKFVNLESIDGNYNNLIIPEIKEGDDKILGSFFDKDNNPDEEENEKINVLCKYLKFELNSNDKSESFDKSTYSIFGMDEFVNNLLIGDQVEGCIVVGNRIYLVDSEGLSLSDNIYIYTDGYIVNSNLIDKNAEFVLSLNVHNNKLLVNSYNYGRSDTYAISCDNNKDSGIAITISNDIPYLRFEQEDIANTSIIFGGNWKGPGANFGGSGSGGNNGTGGSGTFGGSGGN